MTAIPKLTLSSGVAMFPVDLTELLTIADETGNSKG
jgi:hypothetical protein